MADKKISALTAASTPLAGTEVLPIVQSGATVKVAVSDLTAGRAISATSVTASTGNFVVGTSGQGIDFSATPGTGTSELLADYEEGTWTPSQGAGLVVVGSFSSDGQYTKIGRLVTVKGRLVGSTSVAATAAGILCGGLPFSSNGQPFIGSMMNGPGLNASGTVATSGTDLYSTSMAATAVIYFSVTYFV